MPMECHLTGSGTSLNRPYFEWKQTLFDGKTDSTWRQNRLYFDLKQTLFTKKTPFGGSETSRQPPYFSQFGLSQDGKNSELSWQKTVITLMDYRPFLYWFFRVAFSLFYTLCHRGVTDEQTTMKSKDVKIRAFCSPIQRKCVILQPVTIQTI